MAIKGRREYHFYLDANCIEEIKDFLNSCGHRGGMSGFLNEYCCQFSETLESADEDTLGALFDEYGSD